LLIILLLRLRHHTIRDYSRGASINWTYLAAWDRVVRLLTVSGFSSSCLLALRVCYMTQEEWKGGN